MAERTAGLPQSQAGLRISHPVRAPALPSDAGPWLNGGPSAGWRGAVTLVEFWTYSCVNCLRTLPALRAWHARYAGHGLTILGVHTPEFPFERDPAQVARALRELGVTYPVVLDNDRAIWARFANRYWPHRYLIDRAGRIRHNHAGEGGTAATERAIRELLAEGAPADAPPLPPPAFPLEDGEAGMGAVCIPGTPELFAGYYRGVAGNPEGFQEDTPGVYGDPGGYREGYIHLQGRWRVDADAAVFVGPEPGWLRVAFRGTAPNGVLAPVGDGPVRVRIGVTPADAAGDPDGGAALLVDAPRLYELGAAAEGAAGASGLSLLTLAPEGPGLAVYSFTFRMCVPTSSGIG